VCILKITTCVLSNCRTVFPAPSSIIRQNLYSSTPIRHYRETDRLKLLRLMWNTQQAANGIEREIEIGIWRQRERDGDGAVSSIHSFIFTENARVPIILRYQSNPLVSPGNNQPDIYHELAMTTIEHCWKRGPRLFSLMRAKGVIVDLRWITKSVLKFLTRHEPFPIEVGPCSSVNFINYHYWTKIVKESETNDTRTHSLPFCVLSHSGALGARHANFLLAT